MELPAAAFVHIHPLAHVAAAVGDATVAVAHRRFRRAEAKAGARDDAHVQCGLLFDLPVGGGGRLAASGCVMVMVSAFLWPVADARRLDSSCEKVSSHESEVSAPSGSRSVFSEETTPADGLMPERSHAVSTKDRSQGSLGDVMFFIEVILAGVVVAMTQALAAASFCVRMRRRRLREIAQKGARDRSKVWHASPVTGLTHQTGRQASDRQRPTRSAVSSQDRRASKGCNFRALPDGSERSLPAY